MPLPMRPNPMNPTSWRPLLRAIGPLQPQPAPTRPNQKPTAKTMRAADDDLDDRVREPAAHEAVPDEGDRQELETTTA